MEQTPQNIEELDGVALRRLVLERLRFERLMGVETAPRIAVKLAAAPASVAPPRAQPERPVAVPRPTLSAQQIAAAQLGKQAAPPAAPTSPEVVAQNPALGTGHSALGTDKAERWRVLESKAMACQACVLARGRTNVVFGTGNRSARLLFVGEGPGQDEDLQGLPFVGKAGQLLNKIIGAMGFAREDVYICNVVKCRPPQNRAPLPDEVAACSPYLFEQIDLVAPKVIVALGGPAVKTLLNTPTGITALRGRWHIFRGIPLMPTFHPAFVLRQYTEETRGQVWADMQKVMEKLKEN